MTAATMFMDVMTDFGGNFIADPGRQARARPGPPPLGAPVLAEHPLDQGRASSTASTTSTSGPQDFGIHYVPGIGAGHRRWASARSRSTRST